MRLIDEEGKQLGIVLTRDALDIARERGLDLVEVQPNAAPPVCRLMDYGRFRYEESRKEREISAKVGYRGRQGSAHLSQDRRA